MLISVISFSEDFILLKLSFFLNIINKCYKVSFQGPLSRNNYGTAFIEMVEMLGLFDSLQIFPIFAKRLEISKKFLEIKMRERLFIEKAASLFFFYQSHLYKKYIPCTTMHNQ